MEFDVEVYAARVDVAGGRVPGFALVFADESHAEAGFSISTDSLVEGQLPSSEVQFEYDSVSQTYEFRFSAGSDAHALLVRAGQFPPPEVEAIRWLSSRVDYYFIVFGYYGGNGSLALLEPTEHALFKSVLLIDGENVLGRAEFAVPWRTLLDLPMVLGTFR